jgi:tetratricopeptide (TPR) repeat protein
MATLFHRLGVHLDRLLVAGAHLAASDSDLRAARQELAGLVSQTSAPALAKLLERIDAALDPSAKNAAPAVMAARAAIGTVLAARSAPALAEEISPIPVARPSRAIPSTARLWEISEMLKGASGKALESAAKSGELEDLRLREPLIGALASRRAKSIGDLLRLRAKQLADTLAAELSQGPVTGSQGGLRLQALAALEGERALPRFEQAIASGDATRMAAAVVAAHRVLAREKFESFIAQVAGRTPLPDSARRQIGRELTGLDWVQRGLDLSGANKREQAIAAYTVSLWLEPSQQAFYNRAQELFEQGKCEAALADHHEAVRLDGGHDPDYVIERGIVRDELGDLAGAVADYTEALRIDPKAQRALNNRACSLQTMNDLAGAERDFAKALKLDPTDPWPINNRAEVRWWRGNHAQAREDWERAVEVCTTHLKAHDDGEEGYLSQRAIAYRNLGKLKEALKDLDAAVKLSPEDADRCANRACVRLELGDARRALADTDRALKINPRSPYALTERANALLELGEATKAVAAATEAVGASTTWNDAHLALVDSLTVAGRLADAVAAADRLLAQSPGNSRALAARGRALHQAGDRKAAMADFEKALAGNPHLADAFEYRAEASKDPEDLARALEETTPGSRQAERIAKSLATASKPGRDKGTRSR